jgi:hypothetical protein
MIDQYNEISISSFFRRSPLMSSSKKVYTVLFEENRKAELGGI